MIEHYMEKDLFRQLIICERFHKNSYVSIHDLAQSLDVQPKTIESDIQKLSLLLEDAIFEKRKEKKVYRLVFDSQYTLYELRKPIYQNSIFLKVCQMVAQGDYDYLTIADNHFVSVSKTYALVHQAKDFLEALGFSFQDKQLMVSEVDWRLLQLMIVSKIEEGICYQHSSSFANACEQFIDEAQIYFTRNGYSEENRAFLRHGLYIGYLRQAEHPIDFDPAIEQVMLDSLFKESLEVLWNKMPIKEYFEEQEFLFVYFLFRSCNYSYGEILTNYQGLPNTEIKKFWGNPLIAKLVEELSDFLGEDLKRDRAFEYAFVPLVRTFWRSHQPLLPQTIYLPDSDIQDFYDRITEIFENWQATLPVKCYFNRNLIYQFINDYARLYAQKQNPIRIIVVTDSPIKFLVYQNYLKNSWLEINVEPTSYPRIADALEQVQEEGMILCEESCLVAGVQSRVPIVPISLSLINQPNFGYTFYQHIEQYSSLL